MPNIYDEKMYASERSYKPRKDARIGKWVVRWSNNSKWENKEFNSDADAWLFYYQCVKTLKEEFFAKQNGGR